MTAAEQSNNQTMIRSNSIVKSRFISKRAINLARLMFTVALLGALVHFVSWSDLLTAILATQWTWLLLMYTATLVAVIASAYLLASLLRAAGLFVRVRRVVLATSLSVFYALILPGDVLGGLAKWVDLSAATGKKAKVLSAIVFAKAIAMLPPLVLGSAAFALHNPFPNLPLATMGFGLSLTLVLTFAFILHPLSGAHFDRMGFALAENLPDLIGTRLRSLVASVADFRTISARTLLSILLLASLDFSLGVSGYAFAILAVGETVPINTLVWINMALFLTGLLPITFSNLGVREGFLVIALGLYGVAPATSVAVGLLVFTNVVLIALFGGAYQVALSNGWVAWKTKELDH